jgi:gamma-glutamylcyclotransferase (GGCT)/AIG2-like uncharacterized protein YtfP
VPDNREIDLLFVYGTLRREFQNAFALKLREAATLVARTTVAGSIFRIGEYPAYRPEPPGQVHGELYRLADPSAMLKALDEYEAPNFARASVEVSTGHRAWIYLYATQPSLTARILSGDFLNP